MKSSVICLLLCILLSLGLMAADKKAISDDGIYDQVRRVLANDSEVKGGALDVDVKNGTVTVKGKVESEAARKKIPRLCKKVKGVTEVNNQVKVQH